MAYTPTNWVNGSTPVNTTNLNHLETGVDDVDTRVAALEAAGSSTGFLQFPTAGSQLQSMLDAQNAGTAGAIILGPQTYTISTALQLYNGSCIIGVAPDESIISYTGSGGNALEPDNQTVRGYFWNLSGFNVQDAGTGAVGINMIKQSLAMINNVKVDGFTTGVSMTGTDGETVYNRFFAVQASNATTGFLCGASGSNSNVFIGCRTNVCTTGVQITDSNQNAFVGCHFESGTDGIKITSTTVALSDNNTIMGCRFEGTTGYAWDITSTNVRYTNIVGNGTFGIEPADIQDLGTRTLMIDSYLGFKISSPFKPVVTGSKGGNAALTSLMSALSTLGLVTDSTS